jgi:hypothetical protein
MILKIIFRDNMDNKILFIDNILELSKFNFNEKVLFSTETEQINYDYSNDSLVNKFYIGFVQNNKNKVLLLNSEMDIYLLNDSGKTIETIQKI